ncbi:hypothetical protein V6N12_007483 [Hibiscus sabdariffa]|uniref:Uncharacterized protein n=1 Tax=Hibiscus sabdariffa TaxID=183260 RepID=A0ABR2F1X0_9ROSI
MVVGADGEQNIVTNRALGDILETCLGCELIEEVCEMVSCSNDDISWARKVDMENGNIEACAHESDVEPEQDKYLSVKEKRNRDCAVKKSTKVGKKNVSFELIDYSPSDSDIARMQKLTMSARKTLELGKRLGMEIIGDEEEVVAELVGLGVKAVLDFCFVEIG